jgi:prepilin-type N-terminal cleavage/methylation domain-containing protein
MYIRHRQGSRAFTLVEIMIVIAIIGLLMAIAIPNFTKARQLAQARACVENITQIESAKTQWGLDARKGNDDTPTTANLFGLGAYIRVEPKCPTDNGSYNLKTLGERASCAIHGDGLH